MKSRLYSQAELENHPQSDEQLKRQAIGLAAMLAVRPNAPFRSTVSRIIDAANDRNLHIYFDRFGLPCGYFILKLASPSTSGVGRDLAMLTDFCVKHGYLRPLATELLTYGEAIGRRICFQRDSLTDYDTEIARLSGNRIRPIRLRRKAFSKLNPHGLATAVYNSDWGRQHSLISTPNAQRIYASAEASGGILISILSADEFLSASLDTVHRFVSVLLNLRQFALLADGRSEGLLIWGWLRPEAMTTDRLKNLATFHPSELNDGEHLCLLLSRFNCALTESHAIDEFMATIGAEEQNVYILPDSLRRLTAAKPRSKLVAVEPEDVGRQ